MSAMLPSVPPAVPPARPPALALWLGYAGLAPFVAGALTVWLAGEGAQAFALRALAAYGAVIVAFLGGIHWGIGFRGAATGPGLYVWGVLPSLVAWVALLLPAAAGLALLGSMLLACHAVDRIVYPLHGLAHWLPLRLRLSAVAAASCFVGAVGA